MNCNNSVQQGKGHIERSKKARRSEKEKEDSYSFLSTECECDSRNSNFDHGITSNSNGECTNIRSSICAGEVQGSDNKHFSEDFQAGCCEDNMRGDEEDVVQEALASNLSWDPLTQSICSLQMAQESLEQEIKKFREIGNGPFSPDDADSTKCSSVAAEVSAVDLGFHKSYLSGQSGVEEVRQISSSYLELKVLNLTENINILESKSEELKGMLALKDSRTAELEIALTGDRFPKEECTCTIGLLDENFKDVEFELESIFRKKVEAAVEYLAITKIVQNLEVASSAFTLLEKQETIPSNPVQVPKRLEEAHNKDLIMKNRADELERYSGEIFGVKETFMMQRTACKLTFCLFLQFMLLILVFWLLVSQSLPNSGVVVPT